MVGPLRVGDMITLPIREMGFPVTGCKPSVAGRITAISQTTITVDFWRPPRGLFWRKRAKRMAGK